jgi:threonine dehydrogenase-like Zn-dependent dehydrogenase
VLFESAGVAMHAIQQAGDITGKSVLVTGTGPVGLFLISILRALGAGQILALEPNKQRREPASAEGAVTFGADDTEDLLAACRMAGPLRGVEVAFEVSGAAPAYRTAFAGLGLEGTLVSVGHSSNPVPVIFHRM